MGEAAYLKPWHGPALGGLAHELAVQKGDHVYRIIEPYAEFAALYPCDLSRRPLAGSQLHRHSITERTNEVGRHSDAQRGDLADLARVPDARMVQSGLIEGSVFVGRR